jgi:hypothetical protein
MSSPEDLFAPAPDATPLDENECQGLIPSISTRSELNALERLNINEARIWAMRPKRLRAARSRSECKAEQLDEHQQQRK